MIQFDAHIFSDFCWFKPPTSHQISPFVWAIIPRPRSLGRCIYAVGDDGQVLQALPFLNLKWQPFLAIKDVDLR